MCNQIGHAMGEGRSSHGTFGGPHEMCLTTVHPGKGRLSSSPRRWSLWSHERLICSSSGLPGLLLGGSGRWLQEGWSCCGEGEL